MRIRRASAVVALAALLAGVVPARGGIPVFDEIASVQRAQQIYNELATYVRQGQQLINEYNMIRHQITQITHAVTNLQRIPQGLNMLDQLQAYSTNLTGLLNRATFLSYEVNQTEGQFDTLYRKAATVATSDLSALRQKFLTARQEAASTAVQTQAIKTNLSMTMERILILLNGSWLAKGNLDSQQLKAQQDAVRASQEAQKLLVETTAARLVTMKEAEDVANEQLRQRLQQDFTAPAPVYEGGAGALPTWRWTDQ